MPNYCVNANTQSNGDNEVHETTCRFVPRPSNQVALGYHASCTGAVSEAKRLGYSRANGCATCSPACHTS